MKKKAPSESRANPPSGVRRRQPPRAPRLRATNSLVLLSSAAVFAVYTAGYVATRPHRDYFEEQLARLDAGTSHPETPREAVNSTSTPAPFRPSGEFTPVQLQATHGTPDASPQETVTPTKPVALNDGTYIGKGSGGHGWVEVTLVIQSGLITSVEISNCGTMYPCSKIHDLPDRVVERQSAAVGWISGASDSSRGFRLAVLAALAKAGTS